MKLEHFLTPYTKIKSKWITDLNVRPETIKLLEENIGKTLSDINCSSIFFQFIFQSNGNENKNKRDLIKLKIFCTAPCWAGNPAASPRPSGFLSCGWYHGSSLDSS